MMNLRRPLLMRAAGALLLAAALSACGFELRGTGSHQYTMPFHSIYAAFPDTSALGTELKRNLRAVDVVIADKPDLAEAQFDVLSENRGRQILSLNSQGRVREYLLLYTVSFRVRDTKGRELLAPTEITLKRNLAFDETQVLAKESEATLLYRDMQSDLVQQIMRRLAALKPAA
jgi:LPS-assembly lipoprotein